MTRFAVLALTAAATAAPAPGVHTAPDPARNKAVARRFLEEAFGPRWRVELVDELHTPDFVVHTSQGDVGLEEDRQALLGWREAAPDLVITVDEVVAEGDRVAVRWTARGTNTGKANGLPGNGQKLSAGGMTFWRLKDGRIAEEWGLVDRLGVMKQLGLLPPK